MKKLWLILWLVSLSGITASAQTPRPAEPDSATTKDLFLLGKVWGFLKYFHPAVTAGRYDWDSALVHFLPEYEAAPGHSGKCDALLSWIDRLGPVPSCAACQDTLLSGAKLRPDFAWINNDNFTGTLLHRLSYIRDNRRLDSQFYVMFVPADGMLLPVSRHEKQYPFIRYPDSTYGLLSLFRFWNMVEYWYPYKYSLATSWDKVLGDFIPRMRREATTSSYFSDVQRLVARIQDTHGWIGAAQDIETYGPYMFPFTGKVVERRLLVTFILNDSLARLAGLHKGDIIDSIDGKSVSRIAEALSPFCPASNQASLYNKLSYKITRTHQQQSLLSVGGQTITVHNQTFPAFSPPDFTPAYFPYPRDSTFCLLHGQIVYINMGKLDRKDSALLQRMVSASRGLIIDNRQNADEMNGTAAVDVVARMLLPPNTPFIRFSSPEPSYPGVYRLRQPVDDDLSGSDRYFKKQVAILVNENTTSIGEFMTMIFQRSPGAKVFGTPTAGADGPVTSFFLPGSIYVQMSNLGVYYPDGTETQRVGIHPDVMVPETLADYRAGLDAPMDAALAWLQAPSSGRKN